MTGPNQFETARELATGPANPFVWAQGRASADSWLTDSHTGGEACGLPLPGGGFQLFGIIRRACFWGTKTLSQHALDTYEPIVERRFLCFVSLSPLDKEMKSRHGQWLTVLKKSANNERAKT
jgi:hypothetical protein